jgi:hypothetical protein
MVIIFLISSCLLDSVASFCPINHNQNPHNCRRKRTADEIQQPIYRVLNNNAMESITIEKPMTLTRVGMISGIGECFAEKIVRKHSRTKAQRQLCAEFEKDYAGDVWRTLRVSTLICLRCIAESVKTLLCASLAPSQRFKCSACTKLRSLRSFLRLPSSRLGRRCKRATVVSTNAKLHCGDARGDNDSSEKELCFTCG